ncbi:uncharacterized protein PF3D7_1120000-like [Haliotis asinina]|uniref:uncharacterized protein PF3D7_1120000-like n=1 Tax=Haliotis asinina TaxID=109174 RepID=UPI0035324696
MSIPLVYYSGVYRHDEGKALALSIKDGRDTCVDCIAFFTDRKEMALERINEDEEKMNERCSTLEPSKVEECKERVKRISAEKKDKANSQSPSAICEGMKFCQSLVTANMNKPTNKVEGKRRCKDCKNFLNDVKEKEMASVASVGELIETEFCGKLNDDRQEKCEAFIERATEKEIELLDLVKVENTCKLLDMCGENYFACQDEEEESMSERCSTLEASKVEEVEGKRRCKDCKNFLNDVKEKEMASVASVGELIETEYCGKLSKDRQEKCESFVQTTNEKEIDILDLISQGNGQRPQRFETVRSLFFFTSPEEETRNCLETL